MAREPTFENFHQESDDDDGLNLIGLFFKEKKEQSAEGAKKGEKYFGQPLVDPASGVLYVCLFSTCRSLLWIHRAFFAAKYFGRPLVQPLVRCMYRVLLHMCRAYLQMYRALLLEIKLHREAPR